MFKIAIGNKLIHIAIALAVLYFGTSVHHGQTKQERTRENPPKYRVAKSEYGAGNDRLLLLFVSVKPKHLNCTDLISLAAKIKADYPKEPQIQVSIFDRYKAAKTFSLNTGSPYYAESMRSLRGGYYLNRKTNEEYISFFSMDKQRTPTQRIDLPANSDEKCHQPEVAKGRFFGKDR